MNKYTAVIFFHGVGDPSRHVSLGSFLDRFELFGHQQGDTGIGSAKRFRYRGKLDQSGNFVPFVELFNIRTSRGGKPFPFKTVRLFEAYWVPEAGGKYSAAYLIFWLLSRILNPIKLLCSSWRSFAAVRIWSLIYLSQQERARGSFDKLEKIYRTFDGWDSRRKYTKGSYEQFEQLIRDKAGSKSCDALLLLAKKWRAAFISYNTKLLLKCGYYSFLIACLAGIILLSVFEVGKSFARSGFSGLLIGPFAVALTAISVSIYSSLRLKRYALDVLTWTLESEKDERIKARDRVVRFGRKIIRTVVDDPDCEDCVLVGHSLGSCIAVEALLREGQSLKAKAAEEALKSIDDNIFKVRDLFTVASPLDRIFYFFQTDRTFSHRYNRVFAEQRLNVSLPPFRNLAVAGKTRITNIWSRYDPISSELHSVRKNVTERADAVRNFECLPPGVPFPIGTHISYFADQAAMQRIYTSVMSGGDVSHVALSPPRRLSITISSCIYMLPLLVLAAMTGPLLGYSSKLPSMAALACGLVCAWGARELRLHHERHAGRYLTR